MKKDFTKTIRKLTFSIMISVKSYGKNKMPKIYAYLKCNPRESILEVKNINFDNNSVTVKNVETKKIYNVRLERIKLVKLDSGEIININSEEEMNA